MNVRACQDFASLSFFPDQVLNHVDSLRVVGKCERLQVRLEAKQVELDYCTQLGKLTQVFQRVKCS